jgi:hypothetical protein
MSQLFTSLSFIVALYLLAPIDAVKPPKVATQFQQNFTVVVLGLKFQGYAYFDYHLGCGFTQFTDMFHNPWTGVAYTDLKTNMSTLYYFEGNGACTTDGPFNKTILDQIFKWEIPDNATFLGYQSEYKRKREEEKLR